MNKYFTKGDLVRNLRGCIPTLLTLNFFNNFIGEVMKADRIIFKLFFFLLLISISSFAQDISVHKYIGKSKSEIIKKYGNPIHQDNTNPAMMCMFYKSSSGSMIFVSDKDGVYQSEASVSFDKEKDARSSIDSFISGSVSNGFTVDSVTTSDFHLQKIGVKVDLQFAENKLTKKFDIKVKANRTSY